LDTGSFYFRASSFGTIIFSGNVVVDSIVIADSDAGQLLAAHGGQLLEIASFSLSNVNASLAAPQSPLYYYVNNFDAIQNVTFGSISIVNVSLTGSAALLHFSFNDYIQFSNIIDY
jgi:hypothetical protein